MASGDTLLVFTPLAAEMPINGYASFDTRNQHPVIDFDSATQESIVFSGALPRGYSGGGLTVTLVWSASTVSADDDADARVKWGVAVERLGCGGTSLDHGSFGAVGSVVAAPAATSGQLQYTEIALADGAPIDYLAAGESFRLNVVRQAAASEDVMSGDAELRFVMLRET